MTAILAIIVRDIRLAARLGGDGLTLVLVFVMVGAVVPFAIGPDRALLAQLAPGIVWIAAFLSMLLGLDRLFRADEDDGTLLLYRHAAIPPEAVVASKLIAHWLLTALPLAPASPLLAVMPSMDLEPWTRPGVARCGVDVAAQHAPARAQQMVDRHRGLRQLPLPLHAHSRERPLLAPERRDVVDIQRRAAGQQAPGPRDQGGRQGHQRDKRLQPHCFASLLIAISA